VRQHSYGSWEPSGLAQSVWGIALNLLEVQYGLDLIFSPRSLLWEAFATWRNGWGYSGGSILQDALLGLEHLRRPQPIVFGDSLFIQQYITETGWYWLLTRSEKKH